MDEMIKTWTLRFPAKENPNMDKVLFAWPIVLQYDVKAKHRLISRKFSGMKFFHLIVRLTNQKPRSFVSVPYTNQIALFAFVGCFCFVRAFSFQGHTKIALNKVIVKQDTWAMIILCWIALRPARKPYLMGLPFTHKRDFIEDPTTRRCSVATLFRIPLALHSI